MGAGRGSPVVRLLPPGNVVKSAALRSKPWPVTWLPAPISSSGGACDGCNEPIAAVVSFVSNEPEFTPPVIYSDATRAKLVFLVEARPATADARKLRPGQPLSVALESATAVPPAQR